MDKKAAGLTRRQLLGTAATAGIAAAGSAQSPARAGEPIRIGFAMSLTGPGAGAGKMMLVGREIWKDEINAKGGLLGRPVQFVYYDDQSNPGNVPGLYAKLIDLDRVDLLCSSFGTNQIAPAMPIVMAKNMVYMGLFGTGVNDTFRYDRYFQILPNGPEGNRSLSLGFFEAARTINPVPRTVALAGEDTEFGQNVLAGARANVARLGLQVVYDRNFPASTVDHTPVVRAIQSARPDLVFVASYPVGSVGMVRAINETGFTPQIFGGAMIGLSFTAIKAQLGPLLNGIVINENYVPEPSMKFPGIDVFLEQYQSRAKAAGTDPLGFWSPFAYAELQILGQAVTAVGAIDQARIADYMHRTPFRTIVGDVKFGPDGEWEKSRILFVQYRDIRGDDVGQFRQPGKAVILYPPALKTGDLIHPFTRARTQ
ncbi:MAG: amino acid ABC transporter substrate-binding protein [Reyranella sp.]|uniref:amino acid ABC transporter substrate-binding protein n=1 Tax=Reyranella sp. TaxID=1929291 RepID=UPI0025E84D90|nr:amino acid ABC transporter substrate-binding protein [Reyranella sp.]MBR2819084.1 amino acid ABC transporter substrate-binding protein [Reyranella sp.]